MSPEPGWQGELQLQFDQQPIAPHGHKTRLVHCQVQAPLKLQRPFYPEGPEVCHGVMLHTAGGMVGGDRLALEIQLQPQAQVLLTTAAAAKAYRSTGATAQQTTHLRVAAGACLEWLPQETIVFNGACYSQRLQVDLEADAVWCGWDIARLGRSARGEQFLQGEWRSHTQVWQAGRPLWIDPQWLQGGSEMLHSLHGLAGHPVVGSFALVGRAMTPDIVQHARQLWLDRAPLRSAAALPGEAGVTRLHSGLICRYRGPSSLEARRWFEAVWRVLRPLYLNRPACRPRVWQ